MRKVEQRSNTTLSRREFLKLGVATGASYLLSELLFFPLSVEFAKEVVFKKVDLSVTGLPKEWDNTVIVHITDLHVAAEGVSEYFTQTCAELVMGINETLKQFQADPKKTFVFDTGDFVSKRASDGNESDSSVAFSSVSKFASLAGTKFFIPGNHDWHYSKRDDLCSAFTQAGYSVLGLPSDEHYVFEDNRLPFYLATTPDFTSQDNK